MAHAPRLTRPARNAPAGSRDRLTSGVTRRPTLAPAPSTRRASARWPWSSRFGDHDVERVTNPIMSPLVWDLAHIAAYEDLWLAPPPRRRCRCCVPSWPRCTTRSRRRAPCAATCRCSTARRPSSTWPTCAAALEACSTARARRRRRCSSSCCATSSSTTRRCCRRSSSPASTSRPGMPRRAAARPPRRRAPHRPRARRRSRPGRAASARRADGFAYDNERPRHSVDVRAFRIGRTPITNATYLTFVEGGGYGGASGGPTRRGIGRRSTTSPTPAAGPAGPDGEWRQRRVDGDAPLDPDEPVVHVSWFEADAFARAHGARLPTEVEWEKAATWDQATGDDPAVPVGRRRPARPATAAPTSTTARSAPRPAGALAGRRRAVRRARDARRRVGVDVDDVRRLPRASAAHPYREYSEVFFGPRLPRAARRLLGDARARAITPTFRNWDLPQRRQIFAGVTAGMGRVTLDEPRIDVHVGDGARARWPTTSSTASPGRSRSCRPSTSTTPAAPSCSTRSASCRSTTRRAPSGRSSHAARGRIVAPHRRGRARRARRGPAAKTRVLLDTGRSGRCGATCRSTSPSSACATAPRRWPTSTPALEVHGIVGDFERHLDRDPAARPRRAARDRVPRRHDRQLPARRAARVPARRSRALLGPGDTLLLGTDLVKDVDVLEAAYDDAAGVTAEFNRNMLRVVNRELGADFDPDAVRPRRVLRPDHEWIEMRLRARRAHTRARRRRSTSTSRSSAARSCARRSRRSSPARGSSADYEAGGLRARRAGSPTRTAVRAVAGRPRS